MTLKQIKQAAKALAKEARERGEPIPHCVYLNEISRALGHKSWNHLAAHFKKHTEYTR
nr:MAG: hypothetical protein [Microvirus sp.]